LKKRRRGFGSGTHFFKEYHIAKNRNTYAKRQREQEKRQRADDKRLKREKKMTHQGSGEYSAETASEMVSQPISENSDDSPEAGLSG